ncbi:(deoxy)nucleoside triphosphate pyrophosphohydrolase [Microbacterium esteraromaticum]|uniref:8-oxo-dGTP diphosphatase n=1 Tax=Microbacterium esteraromaticum TaxID=57043 RepID=A0A7D7WFH6_9MICO|nr:(deoxy)nucleoside triphosphate pyrophosphohydrolase [Microbacterium esteraromaticum]QMU96911.1 (deoxy)nucleoside triphosphate pyrophosphohydrolase [Microbacterium esteraromaticum]
MTQIDVVGAVIVRGDTVLAARRGQTKTLPGMWEFPGGKIEKGETPKEALRREIEEELGCRIEVGERVETTSHEYEFGIVTLTTFYATLISEEPMSTEHSEIRWIRATELGTVDWAPADTPAVLRVVRNLTAVPSRPALRRGTAHHP